MALPRLIMMVGATLMNGATINGSRCGEGATRLVPFEINAPAVGYITQKVGINSVSVFVVGQSKRLRCAGAAEGVDGNRFGSIR